MHIIAAKAVAFKEALSLEFKEYQQRIINNAKALSESLMKRGIKLVSGGTDNHLMLLDLTDTGITGKDLQIRLDEVNITTNKNGIPFDKAKPFITSGLRIGTPAVTQRGFNEADMDTVADLITRALKDFENQADTIRQEVKILCEKHPLYPDFLL